MSLYKNVLLLVLLYMVPLLHAACQIDEIKLSFTRPSYSVNETNGPAQPVLNLSQPVDCCSTISVWVNIEEDTAKEDEDFNATSPVRVLFPGGRTHVHFDVRMVDNVKLEGSEKFIVSIDPLSLPYGIVLGEYPTAEVVIMDNGESTVSFESTEYVTEEGDGHVELTIALTEAVPFNASLELQTIDDNHTTTTRCDYKDGPYNVTIPFNVTTFNYSIPILDDDVYEIDETFSVRIASSSHSQIKIGRNRTANVTIINDEEPVSVSFSQTTFTINEHDGVVTVNLTLSKPTPCCLRLYVEIENITATRGDDYGEYDTTQYNVTVTFPNGTSCSSFNISIHDDIEAEEDETFRITIVDVSLPFGTELGDNFIADVVIVDIDNTLRFSAPLYNICEDEGSICVDLILDEDALFDTIVEVNTYDDSATSATDYEAGPYYVNIAEGDMNASLCINITDNNKLDNGKIFDLIINTTVLHPEIFSPDPNSTVIILDDEFTFYFNQSTFVAAEDDGYVLVNLTFGSELLCDSKVQFRYEDLTATANVSNGTGLTDYYVSNACPNFAIVPAGSKYYILNIIIVPDNRLEENELFRIYVDEPKALDGVVPIQADVIIMNDDDFILGFDNISYEVNTKNQPDIPIIKFHTLPEYDSQYDHTLFFPIGMTIQEVDGTAIGSYADNKGDYVYQNYSFTLNSTSDEYPVIIRPVDDNIVEPDEYFTLNISFVGKRDHLMIVNQSVTVTIYNDDVCVVRIIENKGKDVLYFSKQLSTNITVNITYQNGTGNQTIPEGFTAEEIISKNYYLLPDNVIEVEVFVREDFLSKKSNLVAGKGEHRIKIIPVKPRTS